MKYITLVNLLSTDGLDDEDITPFDPSQPDADRVLFPEYLTCEDKSAQIAGHIDRVAYRSGEAGGAGRGAGAAEGTRWPTAGPPPGPPSTSSTRSAARAGMAQTRPHFGSRLNGKPAPHTIH